MSYMKTMESKTSAPCPQAFRDTSAVETTWTEQGSQGQILAFIAKDVQTIQVVPFSLGSDPTCRGTSLIRNIGRLGPYSRTMPRALWQS